MLWLIIGFILAIVLYVLNVVDIDIGIFALFIVAMAGEPDVAGTYEKIRIENSIAFRLENVESALSSLSKERNTLPSVDLFDKMRMIEEDLEKTQQLVITLSIRRGSSINELLDKGPELTEKPLYSQWRNYILGHLQILYQSLDEMHLLLTEVPYLTDWGDAFFLNAQGATFMEAAREALKKALCKACEHTEMEHTDEECLECAADNKKCSLYDVEVVTDA